MVWLGDYHRRDNGNLGYDVEGLDTKVYLDGFSRRAGLTQADVMGDLHELVDGMTNRSGERVALVGWSEGAGLSVLGAAADGNKKVLTGIAVFGLGDENAIAWHRMDNLESLIKKPNEPTFRASDYMAKIAPLPFFMIQSTHDQYTPLDEAQHLFALAQEPKRFVMPKGGTIASTAIKRSSFARCGKRWSGSTENTEALARVDLLSQLESFRRSVRPPATPT